MQKTLMITGHVINWSPRGSFYTILFPHPSTVLRCLTSVDLRLRIIFAVLQRLNRQIQPPKKDQSLHHEHERYGLFYRYREGHATSYLKKTLIHEGTKCSLITERKTKDYTNGPVPYVKSCVFCDRSADFWHTEIL